MTRRHVTLTPLVVTALAAGVARAQVVGTLGAGTGHVTYDDTPRLTVVALTPAVTFEGERTTISAAGSFTRFDGGIWSAQAIAAGSRFTEARGPFRASSRRSSRAIRTAVRAHGRGDRSGARPSRLGGRSRLWLGAGAGHAWRSPAGGAVVRADVGAWAQLGDATVRLTAAHNSVGIRTRRVSAEPNMAAEVIDTRSEWISKETVRFVDTEAHVSWSYARVALDALAGRRMVRDGDRTNTWLLGGSVMLTDRLAIVGATGESAFDVAQGLPEDATPRSRCGSPRARVCARDVPGPSDGAQHGDVAGAGWNGAARRARPHARRVE